MGKSSVTLKEKSKFLGRKTGMKTDKVLLNKVLTVCLATGMLASVPVSANTKAADISSNQEQNEQETKKEYPLYETYYVVNCKESITLRPKPDVKSGEICQIPLGATVSFIAGAANGFYEIYYMGQHGYSLADYLEFQ